MSQYQASVRTSPCAVGRPSAAISLAHTKRPAILCPLLTTPSVYCAWAALLARIAASTMSLRTGFIDFLPDMTSYSSRSGARDEPRILMPRNESVLKEQAVDDRTTRFCFV